MTFSEKVQYRYLDSRKETHGLEVQAPSMQRLFVQAALALTDHFISIPEINDQEKCVVELQADSPQDLMVNWLNEVLYQFDSKKFLANRIVFEHFDGNRIQATLWGEYYDSSRHGVLKGIRAISYSLFFLQEETEPSYVTRLSLE